MMCGFPIPNRLRAPLHAQRHHRRTLAASGAKNPNPVKADDDPSSSADPALYFDWWTADLAAAPLDRVRVCQASHRLRGPLYWFDDTGHGAVRVPASCVSSIATAPPGNRLMLPASTESRNRYNKIAFRQVTTTALRVEVTMQPSYSAGIQRWRVK